MDAGMNPPTQGEVVRRPARRNPAGSVNPAANVVQPVDGVMTPVNTVATPVNGIAQPVAAVAADSVRWGAVWAGLFSAFTIFLVLEMLAGGFGLFNAGANGAPSSLTAWITGVIALIAFFVGGLISESTSAVRGSGAGAMTGFLVWALGITLIVAFSLFGLSQLFGAIGTGITSYLSAGHTIAVPGVNPSQVTGITQSTAWGAFAMLVLTAICAVLGGWLGSMGNTPIGRLARRL
jgi:hypothetical protein